MLTGSHLDSVLDGGAYDGPLGVVSALAAVDLLRERGFRPTRPIGVAVVRRGGGLAVRAGLPRLAADDRRTTPGAGPRAARPRRRTPRSTRWPPPASSRDLGRSPLLDSIGMFVELHVEQGRDLVDRGAAVGVASEIWPHGRFRFDFTGEANHAGTTRMEDRHDPMLTYAMTALAANKQARLAGQRATFGRVDVAPNGTNAVPSRVTGWLDARCATDADLTALLDEIERQGRRAGPSGTAPRSTVTAESVSGVGRLRRRPRRPDRPRPESGDWPVIPTQAGHDAGILSAAGRARPRCCSSATRPASRTRPTRPPTTADCLAGVEALADTLERLAAMTHATCSSAPLVGAEVRADVLVTVEDGRFTGRVGLTDSPVPSSPPGLAGCHRRCPVERVPGLTLPGLANCHSHAFHRALRGRTQQGSGTFWTWREQMYAVGRAARPGHLLRARARRPTGRCGCAGITAVGEFHYLHHQPDGTPYDDPNAMGDRAGRGGATRPGSGSRCSTPATCAAGFGDAPPSRRNCASSTPTRTPGGPEPRNCAEMTAPSSAPPSTPSAPSRASTSPRSPASGPTRRCTSTSPSRSPRTRTASRRTASPRRSCSPTRAPSVRAPAPSTPPTSPTPTSGCSGPAAPTPASARPPSATSATASARRGSCTTRAAG